MQKEFILKGLNCANCANKIEQLTNNISGVNNASVDFISKKLKVEIEMSENKDTIINNIKYIVNQVEPDVEFFDKEDYYNHINDIKDGDVNLKKFIILIIGSIFFLIPLILKINIKVEIILFFISYVLVGLDVIFKASKNIFRGQIFDENFLMVIATIGAFLIGKYPEAVAVMLFYKIGEMFQDVAINRSRKSIKSLLNIRPDYANILVENELIRVNPNEVNIDDMIVVKPGEKIPLDGVVVKGESMIDTSNITGESVPKKIRVKEDVLSGCVNIDGVLTVKVTKQFEQSTISKILDLVENASNKKAKTENFITKFARYYTPIVVFSSLAIAFLPPLILGTKLNEWIYRALIFLVVSCPCALVISIPLGFFGGIGSCSKMGILVKGANYLEALNKVNTIVFDKTGTLTKGVFKVTEINEQEGFSKQEILTIAAYGETYSNHPIGKSILETYGKSVKRENINNYKEVPGKGIKVEVQGDKIIIGNKKMFQQENIQVDEVDCYGTIVYISKNNQYVGNIVVSDEIKENSFSTINKFKKLGIKTIMLTGDNKILADKVSNKLNIDKVYGELLPQDKVFMLEEIIKNNNKDEKVIFVGDGVNDAPVLARSDIGVAMGGMGSDAAIEAADIVIMNDDPKKLITSINISKRTRKIVLENIIFSLGVKVTVLIFGALGFATMWEAVFADVGVTLIAVLNSIRVLKVEE